MPRRRNSDYDESDDESEHKTKRITKKTKHVVSDDDEDDEQIFENYDDGKYNDIVDSEDSEGMNELQKEELLEKRREKEDQEKYVEYIRKKTKKDSKQKKSKSKAIQEEDNEEDLLLSEDEENKLKEKPKSKKEDTKHKQEQEVLPLTLSELQSLCLKRSDIVNMLAEPYLHEYCKNMFVKLAAGRDPHTNAITFRICTILEVVIDSETYVVDGVNCNILLKLQWGTLVRDWQLIYILNTQVTEGEYKDYIHIMKSNEKNTLTSPEVASMLKEKKALATKRYSEADIDKTIQRNMETLDLTCINIVSLKQELSTSILLLKQRILEKQKAVDESKNHDIIDTYAIAQYNAEIDQNEERIEKLEQKLHKVVEEEKRRIIASQKRLEIKRNITLKHKEMNAKALLKAQSREANETHNAFKRIQTVPAINYAATLDTNMKTAEAQNEENEEINDLKEDLHDLHNHNSSSNTHKSDNKNNIPLSKSDLLPSLQEIHNFELDLNLTDTSASQSSFIEKPKRKGMSLQDYLNEMNNTHH